MTAVRAITVFSHARPAETDDALRELVALAGEQGVSVRLGADETAKHPQISVDMVAVEGRVKAMVQRQLTSKKNEAMEKAKGAVENEARKQRCIGWD